MYLLRQRYPEVLSPQTVESLTRYGRYRPIGVNSFSTGKVDPVNAIAGGKLSTHELCPDARTAAPGIAAQDKSGDAQCFAAGAANGLWPSASFEFPAQQTPAFSAGAGPGNGGTASGSR